MPKIVPIFYDTEFSERGPEHPIELISLGACTLGGEEFYGGSLDYSYEGCNSWVKENVLPQLPQFTLLTTNGIFLDPSRAIPDDFWTHRSDLAVKFQVWVDDICGPKGKPLFSAYYADYDHVCLCQLFGTMLDLPEGWPMWTFDLKQWCWMLGDPRLPKQHEGEHDALADARWNREVYRFLYDLAGPPCFQTASTPNRRSK